MTTARFLTLDQVAEELATSRAQIYTLPSAPRHRWLHDRRPRPVARLERSKHEEYLERTYAETDAWPDTHADELTARAACR